MKPTRLLLCLAVILALILLDQGVKLAVHQIASFVEKDAVLVSPEHRVDVCVDPTLHARTAEWLAPLAERTGVPFRLLAVGQALLLTAAAAVLGVLFLWVIYGLFWDLSKPRYTRLNTAVLCLGAAATGCRLWMDDLLWGGSLDWLRITWLTDFGERMVEGHTHPLPYVRFNLLIFDLKDVYLVAACVLFFLRLALFLHTYARCTPEEKAGLRQKERHPIRNLKAMQAHAKTQKETKP